MGQNASYGDLTINETSSASPNSGDNPYAGITDLDLCVSKAILNENTAVYNKGDFAAEAHTVLGTAEDGAAVTVYASTLYLEFDYLEGYFHEVSGGQLGCGYYLCEKLKRRI
jgi:hypothetical protein